MIANSSSSRAPYRFFRVIRSKDKNSIISVTRPFVRGEVKGTRYTIFLVCIASESYTGTPDDVSDRSEMSKKE